MLSRRSILAAPLGLLPLGASAQDRFAAFLTELRAEAERGGVRASTVDAALAGLQPLQHVLDLQNRQPEAVLTWAQYRTLVLPQSRLDGARAAFANDAALLRQVADSYNADPRVVVGIWGLESGFGAHTGSTRVVKSLVTLAYAGRRAAFFHGELLAALRILDAGDIGVHQMTGSWAGAMGQPQFMPSSYLRFAVDANNDGRRDIWADRADVFGSIANYLGRSGWRSGEPWCQPITVPGGDLGRTGHDAFRTLAAWQDAGVRRIDGRRFSRTDVQGGVLQPDGAGGEAFMVYHNFNVIRRYNSPDNYALAVGLLGNAAA